MTAEIIIRNYQPRDLWALVALINDADAIDRLEQGTSLEKLENQMSSPNMRPETDCFLAWDGDWLVGYTRLFVRRGNGNLDSVIHCRGLVHPFRRQQGLGRRLLETGYHRATDYLDTIGLGQVRFQCEAREVEEDRKALFKSFGLKPVRHFVNLARPLNGNLPPVQMPDGIRLRTFDPAQDAEVVWRVDQEAFLDHWGYTEGRLEDFLHWMKRPYIRPELWLLAEEEATGKVVGLGLNEIDPHWIAETGRQEGYVDTLAVLREYRGQGLGTAILAQSLHALRQAGMEAAHLHADAENLTGAMRIYERAGFRLRKTVIAYQKVIQEAAPHED